MSSQNKVTTERTSKKIKLWAALWKLALVASVVMVVFGPAIDLPMVTAMGALGIPVSILGIIFTRWARWWQHD